MLKNFFFTAYRNIIKNKFYSFLNILGLSIGVVAAILILLYLQSELGFDSYFEKADRIYRLESGFTINKKADDFALTSFPLARVIKKDYPVVENYVRFIQNENTLMKYENQDFYEDVFLADSTVFEIFTHEFIYGNPAEALNRPNCVVLSEKLANKIFGSKNPLGEILTTGKGNTMEVTGVFKNLPSNVHMKYEALLSMVSMREMVGADAYNSENSEAFWNVSSYSFILLKPNTNIQTIFDDSDNFYKKYMSEIGDKINGTFHLKATLLKEIHFAKNNLQADFTKGNVHYLYIFLLVGLFVLLLASINYMNMATARSANRGKEVGIRKVVGAHKKNLIFQFITESILLTFISFLIALLIMELVLPIFNNILNTQLDFGLFSSPQLFGYSLIITIVVGFLSGIYPAFYLSSFRPILVLKGKAIGGKTSGTLRKLLVIIQISITSIMVVGTIVVSGQLKYMRNFDTGFNKENKIILPKIEDSTFRQKYDVFREKLLTNPNIINASSAMTFPGTGFGKQVIRIEKDGEMSEVTSNFTIVDYEFIPLLEIKLLDGRNFDRDKATDIKGAFIINETAAKVYGWKNPIGKRMQLGLELDGTARRDGVVIGVVRDFHFNSVNNAMEPFLFILPERPTGMYCISIAEENRAETLKFIEKTYFEMGTKYPFNYFFLDENLAEYYEPEERIALIFKYFTIITLIIAGLGILGLSAFMAEQRNKEIGIRKVLGASVSTVTRLFVVEFGIYVGVANVISWGLAYYGISKWLQNFEYKWILGIIENSLQWIAIFISAAAITFVFTIATVAWQVVKAAYSNPVDTLKVE